VRHDGDDSDMRHLDGRIDVRASQIVAYLDSVGGLDLEARIPWPGRPQPDEALRPIDARTLLGSAADGPEPISGPAEDRLRALLGGDGDGTATSSARAAARWDLDAWYRPVHLTAYDSGIVVREKAVVDLACDLAVAARASSVRLPATDESARQLLRMAFTVLFLHQQFHHRVEMLALRMQVVEQRPRYIAYYREAYARAAGTDDQLEEALANAYVYRALARRAHCSGIPNELRRAVCEFVKQSWAHDEPGYRVAGGFVAPEAWDKALGELHGRVNEASTTPQRRATWRHLGPDLTTSIIDPSTDVAVVAPHGSPPSLPGTVIGAPVCTAAQMLGLLEAAGYAAARRGRGTHVRLTAKGRAVAILPAAGSLSPAATTRLLALLDATPADLPTLLAGA
jgi:hypothetical protein